MRGDGVVVVELALSARLVSQCVVVEVDPEWFATSSMGAPAGRGATLRRVEGVVLDVLAVVLERDAGLGSHVPQVALLLVGNRIAAVGGVVAEPVGRLNVVRVGRHGLHDPVVAVGRLPARVVVVVEEREALHQRVRVGRDRAVGCVVAEDCQGGVAIAGGHIAQDLVVGAVFTNDQEDVLDLRRIADPRPGLRPAWHTGCRRRPRRYFPPDPSGCSGRPAASSPTGPRSSARERC